jgi:hypothetical protein
MSNIRQAARLTFYCKVKETRRVVWVTDNFKSNLLIYQLLNYERDH